MNQHSSIQHSGRIATITGLIVLAALSRLLPHPPNFTPITAMALFGALSFDNKRLAMIVPLIAMMISDVALGILHGSMGYVFHSAQLVIYACFVAIAYVGTTLAKSKPNVATVSLTVVGSSLFFFVISNFAVWLFDNMYAHTAEGLAQCFAMAVPFYNSNGFAPYELLRNAIAGDVFYTALLFGAYYVAGRVLPKPVKA